MLLKWLTHNRWGALSTLHLNSYCYCLKSIHICTSMYYYLYPPIEYRSSDILGKCVTMPHTFTSQEHQRSWAELAVPVAGLAWLAWLLLGWIGSACGWPGCSWAATVQFCNEFPGSKYTLHLKVPKIAEFHALKLSTVKLSTAIWLHKWLITIKDHLTRIFLFCVIVPFAPCFELLQL